MTAEEKIAYRHLLYCVMLELRSGRRGGFWWRASRELKKTKSLADAFHNLAFFSREDFVAFEPERFWSDLKHCSQATHDKYKRIFLGYLEGKYAIV